MKVSKLADDILSRDLLPLENSEVDPEISLDFENSQKIYSEVEQAAKEANIFDFIMNLPNKFQTLVGER